MKRNDESFRNPEALARHSLSHTVENLDITTELDDEDDNLEPSGEPRVVSLEPGHIFEERYNVLEDLGKGKYGIVRKVIDKSTNTIFAAKFIRAIQEKDRKQVYDEIKIMNQLWHPKLLALRAAFENRKEIIMITEYISGGELFERVVADDFTLTEKDVILFMRQICQSVKYMHDNRIVHLDLKPENIMCQTRTSHRIKLIDFGLAQTLEPNVPVRVLMGTPEFVPPEIISYEPIGIESDMWSIGVICYVLLTGLSPFMGESDNETFTNITRSAYDFDDQAFDAISQQAQDFISALLIKKKELRMSAAKCLDHPWLNQSAESMSRVALPTDELKKFIVRRKWQKTGNAIRALGRMATLSANSRRSPTDEFTFDNNDLKNISVQVKNEVMTSQIISTQTEEITFKNNVSESIVEKIEDTIISTPEISPQNEEFILPSNDLKSVSDQVKNDVISSQVTSSEIEELMFENNDSKGVVERTENTVIISTPTKSPQSTELILPSRHSSTNITKKFDKLRASFEASENVSKSVTSSIKNNNNLKLKIVDKKVECPSTDELELEYIEIPDNNRDNQDSVDLNQDVKMSSPTNEEKITHKSITSVSRTKNEEKTEQPSTSNIQNDLENSVKTIKQNSILNQTNQDHSKISDNKKEGSTLSTILNRGVRTGSVNKTAKMFETAKAPQNVGTPGRQVATSESRVKSANVQKAFAFWTN